MQAALTVPDLREKGDCCSASVSTGEPSSSRSSDFDSAAVAVPDLVGTEEGDVTAKWECNACPGCSDVCGHPDCEMCVRKSATPEAFTMCQVRRHNKEHDNWVAAKGYVYDLTGYAQKHPGGMKAIHRKAGQECSKDFDFHTKATQNKEWVKYRIGRLRRCALDDQASCCVVS
mmetsp:Transcript_35607/g.75396  ORF Transcript_35607/g.75396 Transcript_35607/m.75396 type:complete len:173 (+) Transcript_35607:45-563(+)